jgi:hypothetical protein
MHRFLANGRAFCKKRKTFGNLQGAAGFVREKSTAEGSLTAKRWGRNIMKRNSYKRIVVVSTDGFDPWEVEAIREGLADVFEKLEGSVTLTIHCSRKAPQGIARGRAGRMTPECFREESNENAFEEAIHCVDPYEKRS